METSIKLEYYKESFEAMRKHGKNFSVIVYGEKSNLLSSYFGIDSALEQYKLYVNLGYNCVFIEL